MSRRALPNHARAGLTQATLTTSKRAQPRHVGRALPYRSMPVPALPCRAVLAIPRQARDDLTLPELRPAAPNRARAGTTCARPRPTPPVHSCPLLAPWASPCRARPHHARPGL